VLPELAPVAPLGLVDAGAALVPLVPDGVVVSGPEVVPLPDAPMPLLLGELMVLPEVEVRLVDWQPAASTAARVRLSKVSGRMIMELPLVKRGNAHLPMGKWRSRGVPGGPRRAGSSAEFLWLQVARVRGGAKFLEARRIAHR
jgi:hypothetical protein